MRSCPGTPPCIMPLRIWDEMSRTPSAGLCGMNTELDFEFAPISFSVSKYCVMSNSSETLSEESCSSVPEVTDLFRPSTIASRCFAMPSPCRRADSHSASAFFTTRILSASAAIIAASRRRLCLLISFMEFITSWLGFSSVTRALMIWNPYSCMLLVRASFTAEEILSFSSNASSNVIFGTDDRTTSETYESICALTLASLYMADSACSGMTCC
mmetsp:Transcript_47183/g.135074  ORF Transcript_47183/g.135074 Transcript_47183/m.135074 type:complete len:214 (+) Transcript_47183:98-739(+)